MIPVQLFADGKLVRLGDRIGKGGEGEVFALADGSGRAIKIYSVDDTAAREEKISAMVRLRLAEQSTLVAFPLAIVRDRRGNFAGFIMTLVRDHKPLFELYSPGARKQNFPDASYRFLVRAALNTARGVASVHKAGCIIGDINHSGVLISNKAIAALIDADSFQVIDGNRRHLCRVGVPEYTPPELQGLNLGSVLRTTNHDAFGLAIVVFQLLAMGRHPYVGAYANGDLPLPRAIAEHRFAYSRQRSVGMSPPPGAVSLDDFPAPLAQAFETAFGPLKRTYRPNAAQWVSLLEEYEQSLRVCSTEKLHHYSSAAKNCPWCRMEARLGVILFVPSYRNYSGSVPAFDPGAGGFDLAKLWTQIEAIKIPARSQLTPMLPQGTSQPSAEVRAAKLKQESYKVASYVAFVTAALVLISTPQFWIASLGLVVVGFVLRSKEVDVSSTLRQRYMITESQWDTALDDWEKRCGIDRIESLKGTLIEAKLCFEGLADEERQKVSMYQADRRSRQLTDYLERFRIRNVKISGIGRAKEAALASYGIESAADVEVNRVLTVPGFGPINSRPLLEWRQGVESKFVYDPQHNATDRAMLGKIRADTSQKAAELRQQLASGAKELWKAVHACEQMLRHPDPLLSKLQSSRSQIKTDFGYLGIPLPPRPQVPRRVRVVAPTRIAATPRTTTIRSTRSAATPSCPRCGMRMVKRTARRGRRRGTSFGDAPSFQHAGGRSQFKIARWVTILRHRRNNAQVASVARGHIGRTLHAGCPRCYSRL
jgi:DNA-binding helix-hairpin-helix protein with protein kinase domain